MENNKCPNCGFETNDDEFCPSCGTALDGEIAEPSAVDTLAETELSEENVLAEESPNPNKKIKLATALVAIVLVAAVGFFAWYFFAGRSTQVKDMDFASIEGSYITCDNASYVDFDIEKTTVEVADVQSASDAAAASDGAKTKSVTFDGTYKTGYSTEYVQNILAREYVTKNTLEEEYDKYAEEKGIVLDDYMGFIKEKGVSQSKLDEIDKELQLSAQRVQYDQEGYWDFDETTKEIVLYASDGVSEVATLMINGKSIIDPVGFLKGEHKGGGTFNSTFKYSDNGINETVIFYDDGHCIIKAEYEGQDTQYIAGTYKADDKFIVMKINGQSAAHTKVNGGIASVVYEKRK